MSKRNFCNLYKGILNLNEEWLYQEMGKHLTHDILPEDIYCFLKSDIKYAGTKMNNIDYLLLCDCIWHLYKAGYDFRILHKQLRLLEIKNGDEIELFYEYYLRYHKGREKAQKKNLQCLTEKYPMYIRNRTILDGLEQVEQVVYAMDKDISACAMTKEVSKRYESFIPCGMEEEIECSGEKYVTKIPRTAEEIVKEAFDMRNCISSRLPEYIKGEWCYIFLRKKEDMDRPFIDIIIHTGGSSPEIVWCIEKNHVKVRGELLEMVRGYFERHRESLENIMHAAG